MPIPTRPIRDSDILPRLKIVGFLAVLFVISHSLLHFRLACLNLSLHLSRPGASLLGLLVG